MYTITLTNGTELTTISDTTLDTTTSLTLVGKNYLGYGTTIANDLVRLLENAANFFPPPAPLIGQFWYDTSVAYQPVLKVWDGLTWEPVDAVTSVLNYVGAVTLAEMVAGGLAPLVSPALTNIPTAPTATPSTTSTTQLATTAFVQMAIATALPFVPVQQGGGVLQNVPANKINLGWSSAGLRLSIGGADQGILAPLASPAFSLIPTAPTATPSTTSTTQLATTAFVQNAIATALPFVPVQQGGGVLQNTPANKLNLGWMSAGLRLSVDGVDHGLLAPLASPAFSLIPTAPTAAIGTSTTQLATTAFVAQGFAPLVSPALTSVPTAPTAAAGTNNTQIATTAFVYTVVNTAVAPLATVAYVNAVVLPLASVAYVNAAIAAIPSASSGSLGFLSVGTYIIGGDHSDTGENPFSWSNGSSHSNVGIVGTDGLFSNPVAGTWLVMSSVSNISTNDDNQYYTSYLLLRIA